MHTNFGWRGLSGFGVMASFCLPSKTAKISLQTMDYSPWSSKNLINWNWLKKIMQVEVNVLSMHTNFDGCLVKAEGQYTFCAKDFAVDATCYPRRRRRVARV